MNLKVIIICADPPYRLISTACIVEIFCKPLFTIPKYKNEDNSILKCDTVRNIEKKKLFIFPF